MTRTNACSPPGRDRGWVGSWSAPFRFFGIRISFVIRHSTFDIVSSSFGRRPGEGLHDGGQINLIARQFSHLFSVAQNHNAMAVAHDFLQLR